MLFNLGLTADAAAAHKNDLAGPQFESRPARHSSPPALSFAALSSLGLSRMHSKRKGAETNPSHKTPQATMPTSTVDHTSSSDGEHTAAGTAPVLPRVGRAQSVRKPSSRPKTSYQLAHPASHARHRRLKIRPKLLLQMQRVSQTPRPLPVLDVLPSTVFLPRLARNFPTIFRGKKGLGPNDLIVVASDLYGPTAGDAADKYPSSDEENGEHREVIATICQLLRDDALSKGKAEICLDHGPVWEATPLPNGSYEFVANTEYGVQTLRWVLRGGKNRRVSAPPGSTLQEDHRRFTFSVIDPTTRRHPVIATMTHNHLEVFDEYAMPTSGFASPSCGMSVVSDASDMDTPLDRRVIVTDDNLRKLIIITSIWVAFREGWSDNFAYRDSAMTLNSKAICSSIPSRHGSPQPENQSAPAAKDGQPDGPSPNGTKHRVSISSTLPPRANSPSERSIAFGSLSRRSNSTGAAFIERSNRRASAASNRPSRHSLLSSPRELAHNGISENPTQPDPASRTSRPKNQTKADTNNTRSNGPPDQMPDKPQGPDGHLPKTLRSVDPGPTKGKRRHRLSSIFDFIIRKSGNHH